jgi:hypothetical protein
VNNLLPNTGYQQVPTQAKPLKNQQDAVPALSYEPGGRRFESCRARQLLAVQADPLNPWRREGQKGPSVSNGSARTTLPAIPP